MTALPVGSTVRVNFIKTGGFRYIFHVTLLESNGSDRITGRVKVIFDESGAEITGGNILAFRGQVVSFDADDLIAGT